MKFQEEINNHYKQRKDFIEKSFDYTCDNFIEKARSGVYKDTPENRKLGRVGQKYGGKKEDNNKSQKDNPLTLKEKTEKLRNILINKFGIDHIGLTHSETDFGDSSYLTWYMEDELYKVRISDHESTNVHRVENEIMFKDTDTIEKMIFTLEQIMFPERFTFRPTKKGEKPTHIKFGKPSVIIRK